MSHKKHSGAVALGVLGGQARAKKYSKRQLVKWAKLGGRPKGSKNKSK